MFSELEQLSSELEAERQGSVDLGRRLAVLDSAKRAAEEAAAAGKDSVDAAEREVAERDEAAETAILELQSALAAKTADAAVIEARVAELSTQLVEVSKRGSARLAEAEDTLGEKDAASASESCSSARFCRFLVAHRRSWVFSAGAERRAAAAEGEAVRLRLQKAEQRAAREAAEALAESRSDQLAKMTADIASLTAQVGAAGEGDAGRRAVVIFPCASFVIHNRSLAVHSRSLNFCCRSWHAGGGGPSRGSRRAAVARAVAGGAARAGPGAGQAFHPFSPHIQAFHRTFTVHSHLTFAFTAFRLPFRRMPGRRRPARSARSSSATSSQCSSRASGA